MGNRYVAVYLVPKSQVVDSQKRHELVAETPDFATAQLVVLALNELNRPHAEIVAEREELNMLRATVARVRQVAKEHEPCMSDGTEECSCAGDILEALALTGGRDA